MSYQVKIPVFEGPMDLLLHLIEKNEVDIRNIPISKITEQYLEYLQMAEELDLELTSEFILLACTLLSIKARMLLPRLPKTSTEEEEQDPRQELVDKLLEYKQFKEKADQFRELETKQAKVFWREVDEIKLLKEFPPANPLGQLSVADLLSAYGNVLKKLEKRRLVVSIEREEVTVQEKIDYVLYRICDKPYGLTLLQLLPEIITREEIIVTFLALLELSRRGVISLRQNGLFSDIYIYLRTNEGGQENVDTVS